VAVRQLRVNYKIEQRHTKLVTETQGSEVEINRPTVSTPYWWVEASSQALLNNTENNFLLCYAIMII
jgi:hypothetical protein